MFVCFLMFQSLPSGGHLLGMFRWLVSLQHKDWTSSTLGSGPEREVTCYNEWHRVSMESDQRDRSRKTFQAAGTRSDQAHWHQLLQGRIWAGPILPARRGCGRIAIASKIREQMGRPLWQAHLFWKSPREDMQGWPVKAFRSGFTFSVPLSNRFLHVL